MTKQKMSKEEIIKIRIGFEVQQAVKDELEVIIADLVNESENRMRLTVDRLVNKYSLIIKRDLFEDYILLKRPKKTNKRK